MKEDAGARTRVRERKRVGRKKREKGTASFLFLSFFDGKEERDRSEGEAEGKRNPGEGGGKG